jgi:hypothetical protein
MAAAHEAGFAEEMARQRENWAVDDMVKQQQQRELQNRMLGEIQKTATEIKDTKIDPFRSETAGVRIIAGFSDALMALGGNPRSGADSAVQRVIDADIAAQRENLNNKRGYLDAQRGAYTMLRQQGFDDVVATHAARSMMLDSAADQLRAWAAGQKGPQIQTQLDATMAMLDKMKANEDKQLDQAIQQTAFAMWTRSMQAAPPQHIANTVRLPDGRVVAYESADIAKDVTKRVQASKELEEIQKEALQLRGELFPAIKSGDLAKANSIRDQLENLRTRAIYAASTAEGQGVVREHEFPLAMKRFPFTNISPGTEKTIQASVRHTQQQVDAYVAAAGGERVNTGYTRDARGRITPTQQYRGEADAPKANAPRTFEGK